MRKAMAYPCPLCGRTSEKRKTAQDHLVRAHLGRLLRLAAQTNIHVDHSSTGKPIVRKAKTICAKD